MAKSMLNHLIADAKRFLPPDPSVPVSQKATSLVRGMLSPGFQAIVVYRGFRWARQRGIPSQPLRYVVERFVEATTGIQLPVDAEIGPGLRIHHFGGIILHPAVRLGAGCTLFQGVTLGTARDDGGVPVVGNEVTIGAGAKVLGEITLGDRCRVGANAVVVHSCPEDAVLIGIPARNIRQERSS